VLSYSKEQPREAISPTPLPSFLRSTQYSLLRQRSGDHDAPMFARACSLAFAVTAVLGATFAFAGEWCTAIDGYTLRCSGGERVKIEGIRAPELNQPGGEEARQRLQRRIRSGELVVQRGGTDKYGRTLARVYVNGNRISQMDVTPKSVSPKSVSTR
jgi:Staphylococcal nuclease homologue